MYTRKKYSKWAMVRWTRRELRFFILLAALVTILYEVLGLQWLQLPWTPLALVGTAVAFLIGFQSNAAYGRIWEARKIWGGIVNDSRTLTIMVLDMVTNEYAREKVPEEELRNHRKTLVYRHMAWLTALRHAMRQDRPWESFKKNKHNQEWIDMVHIPEWEHSLEEEIRPLLSDEEYLKIGQKTNKPAALMKLQSTHLRSLKEKGLIWEFSFLELQAKMADLITHQGKSERIKNFPYPRQFATLGYDFVNLFIMLIPFGVVPEFSKTGQSLQEYFPVIGTYFVWLAIPFTAMISWVFNTMQRIGTVGDNPFEGSGNDVPISTIARGIEIDLRQMLEEDAALVPGPLEARNDFQM